MNKGTIFLIEENNETRPVLRQILQNHGYQLALAIDKEDALERVSHGEFSADIVIVNLCGIPPEKMLEFAGSLPLKNNPGTPIVAIAEKYGDDMQGKNVMVSEDRYITYLEDGEQLFNLLDALLPKSTSEHQGA